jgi:hypothetical protein
MDTALREHRSLVAWIVMGILSAALFLVAIRQIVVVERQAILSQHDAVQAAIDMDHEKRIVSLEQQVKLLMEKR